MYVSSDEMLSMELSRCVSVLIENDNGPHLGRAGIGRQAEYCSPQKSVARKREVY